MNSYILINIIAFIIFKFLHLLLLFESDIYALIRRIFDKSKQDEVEIFNILARYQFDSTDATRESDFIIFHEKFAMFDEICEKGWYIYNITESYIYFVYIPSIEHNFYESCISIEKCSKLSKNLHNNAERMARIDLETFERVTKSLPPFKCKVVMMHSAACAGGTVAAKLLQACDNSKLSLLVIGEPPVLTSLSILYNSLSIQQMTSLCKSTLRFSLLHQKPNQTVVLKARSSCTKIVPYIHGACPSIQHIFIGRKDYTNAISRLVLLSSAKIPIFSMISWILQQSKYLADCVSSWRLLEKELITKVSPNTEIEFALAQIYGSVVNVRRNIQYFAIDCIYVDDLINDTANQIRPLLGICDVSDLAIPECIEWKRGASDVLSSVFDSVPMAKDENERVAELVQLIQKNCYGL